MPGIHDVAALAGVSTATVSRALNGNPHVSAATRSKVEAAAKELGYVVSSSASGLASGRTKNVGVVVPFLGTWFYGAVLEGIQSTLLNHGYDLTLYNLGTGQSQRHSVFEHFLLRKRVDAVIAVSLELTADETSRLLALHKPIVGIGGPIAEVPTLSVDDMQVARMATDHLISLGHRRIGHIGGDKEFDEDFHLPTNRRLGYEGALQDAGLEVDSGLFQPANFTIEGGYRAAKQLLGDPGRKPTAVFAASDEMAIGTILAARDLGLSVPGDVSVIGIDGHRLSDFFGLSTIAQFPQLQGERAVDLLLAQLDPALNPLTQGNQELPVEMIIRSSTSRPRD